MSAVEPAAGRLYPQGWVFSWRPLSGFMRVMEPMNEPYEELCWRTSGLIEPRWRPRAGVGGAGVVVGGPVGVLVAQWCTDSEAESGDRFEPYRPLSAINEALRAGLPLPWEPLL